MSHQKHMSTAAKAASNVDTLRDWIRKTSLEQVPTNQYGGASRTTILNLLSISRSTAASNPRIAELFEALDVKLRAIPTTFESGQAEAPADPQQHAYVIGLHRENLRLKAELNRIRWSDDTGRSTGDE
ncbi:hypothetical protein [Burkholderia multivorans]|uniref:hypothetical protein n=1 Tax=Burkholderia multivorans TaxID=87883 RepID=UPI0011B21711|nr:hypothetical protein [Burkholderia multivorans]MBU9122146.1 hypothetical protein [Burkholderia multivorans]